MQTRWKRIDDRVIVLRSLTKILQTQASEACLWSQHDACGVIAMQASQPLDEFAKGLTGFGEVFGEKPGTDTELLVSEIIGWIETGTTQQAALPPPPKSVY